MLVYHQILSEWHENTKFTIRRGILISSNVCQKVRLVGNCFHIKTHNKLKMFHTKHSILTSYIDLTRKLLE